MRNVLGTCATVTFASGGPRKDEEEIFRLSHFISIFLALIGRSVANPEKCDIRENPSIPRQANDRSFLAEAA